MMFEDEKKRSLRLCSLNLVGLKMEDRKLTLCLKGRAIGFLLGKMKVSYDDTRHGRLGGAE